jgi:predicted molibdopterin-dependent oxidoreductase YjgC
VLDVARANGIAIPALCYHPKTGKAGRCRACLVEIEGIPGLKESCALAVREGMVVKSASPRVLEARRMVVELLLADGHHNCIACQANGCCELQRMAYDLGIERPGIRIDAEPSAPDASSPGIVRDLDKCIQCGRCVSACQDVVVNEVLAFGGRGKHTRVICDEDVPMGESTCVQCGECSQICPVGALVFRQPKEGRIRPSETQSAKVTCPYCGVGCQIDLHTKDNRYALAMAHEHRWDEQPNKGMLCVKGRFGLDFVDSPERLRTPLVRKDGALLPASWDEALAVVAERLGRVKAAHGADAIGFFTSAKVTNEENYALMRFARGVIGTNNIDHCARL